MSPSQRSARHLLGETSIYRWERGGGSVRGHRGGAGGGDGRRRMMMTSSGPSRLLAVRGWMEVK